MAPPARQKDETGDRAMRLDVNSTSSVDEPKGAVEICTEGDEATWDPP
jgi:hypothetical protein